MNIRVLQYLVAIEEYRHFGKAADACFVSQPTLSMQIKKFEERLGVQLIERTNKSVFMTAIGKELTRRAKEVLNNVEQIVQTAKVAQDPYSGKIVLGSIPTLAPYLLPLIVPKLHKAYPHLKMYFVEERTETLIQQLKDGDIDTMILALPIGPHDFSAHALFEETFYLAVPKESQWSAYKKIKQEQLKDQTLLLLEEGHCLRDQALDVCHHNKANENQNFKATSLETLRQMIAAGVGMTLIPELACRKTDKTISYIPFEEPQPKREIAMLWRKSSARDALFHEIAECIEKL